MARGMKRGGSYGRALGRRFRLEDAPFLVTRTDGKTELAATRIDVNVPDNRITEPMSREDAFLVASMLRDYPDHTYWEEGKQAFSASLRAGDAVFYDLRRAPAILLDKPFHSIVFYLPRDALSVVLNDECPSCTRDLDCRSGAGVVDPMITKLAQVMHIALGHPQQVCPLFVDHIQFALAIHIVRTYGTRSASVRQLKGGLASWQEKRAKDILSENLKGTLPLKTLAAECGLSLSHFSRAFRQSVGMTPHQWLVHRRIDSAKEYLAIRGMTLAHVATASGFADQSHLTRFFKRMVGVSPGTWRRNRR